MIELDEQVVLTLGWVKREPIVAAGELFVWRSPDGADYVVPPAYSTDMALAMGLRARVPKYKWGRFDTYVRKFIEERLNFDWVYYPLMQMEAEDICNAFVAVQRTK